MNSFKEDLIKQYFMLGMQQKEIIAMMEFVHDIEINPRSLKRILRKLNLFRRKNYSSYESVVSYINQQLNRSGQLHGYRWMHLKCIQHGLIITQTMVREALNILDPSGVDLRKRKRLRRRQYINSGPNSVWHMDSYDKLKPYGICINGAIDGFSRHIIWLTAGRTSNDPKVIAGYYLKSIRALGGFPHTVRSDMGTENGTVEKIQTALRLTLSTQCNSKPPFLYIRSTNNQRIESWWGILRKHSAQYWINLFEGLKDEGIYNGSFLDKSLIQFCFLKLIQTELDEVAFVWNAHKIQSTRNCRTPVGKPVMMFQAPHLYGVQDNLHYVSLDVFNFLAEECTVYNSACDEEIEGLCQNIIDENNYSGVGDDPYDAIQLYTNIRAKIYDILHSLD